MNERHKKTLRNIFYVLLANVAVVVGVLGLARLSDGPVSILPGGPLRSGEFVRTENVDWTSLADIAEIEMQLEGESTSRKIWFTVVDGNPYLSCSLSFPPGKTWHYRAVENGDVVLRIDGKRYELTMIKVDDPAEVVAMRQAITTKYDLPSDRDLTDNSVWAFRLHPRSS